MNLWNTDANSAGRQIIFDIEEPKSGRHSRLAVGVPVASASASGVNWLQGDDPDVSSLQSHGLLGPT